MKKFGMLVPLVAVLCLLYATPAHAAIQWYTETTAEAGLVTYTDTTGPFPLFGDPTPHKSGGPSAQTIFEPGDSIFAGAMLDVMAIDLPDLVGGVAWSNDATDSDVISGTGDDSNGDGLFNMGYLDCYDPDGVLVWRDVRKSLGWTNIWVNQQAGHDMLVRSSGFPGGYSFIYEQLRGEPIKPGIYTVEYTGYEGINGGEGEGVLAGSTQFTVIPEPASLIIWGLLGAGAAGLGVWRRRRRGITRAPWTEENRQAIREIVDRGRFNA